MADQAAITVQEIREVGKQGGRLYRMSQKKTVVNRILRALLQPLLEVAYTDL